MLEKDKIVKLIGSIGTRSANLKKDIQEAAVSVVGHALLHGDVTLASRLVEACGSGARRDSLVKWLEIHGPFAYDKKKKTFSHMKRPELKWSETYEQRLELLPWDEAKKETIASVYDQLEQINKLMAVMQAKAKKHEKMEHDYVLGFLTEAYEKIQDETARQRLLKAVSNEQQVVLTEVKETDAIDFPNTMQIAANG